MMLDRPRIPERRQLSRRRFLQTSAGLGIVALAGCSPGASSPSPIDGMIAWPAKDQWPRVFIGAPAEVQEAYRFAVAHPDVMQYFPCFCGCGQDGHRSNYDCYVREARPDGSVVLDGMSFG